MLIHDLLIHSYSLSGSIWTAFTDLGLDVMTSRDHLILQVVISYRCSIANQVCISSVVEIMSKLRQTYWILAFVCSSLFFLYFVFGYVCKITLTLSFSVHVKLVSRRIVSSVLWFTPDMVAMVRWASVSWRLVYRLRE